MIIRRCCLLLMSALVVVSAGCSKNTGTHPVSKTRSVSNQASITKLPATRTAVDTKVVLKSVKRTADGDVKIAFHQTYNKKDPADINGTFRDLRLIPWSKGMDYHGSSVTDLPDHSVIQEYTCSNVPSSIKSITISKKVMSYDGDVLKFNFPLFSADQLPLRREIGNQYVTVKRIYIIEPGPEDDQNDYQLHVKLEASPGYTLDKPIIKDEIGHPIRSFETVNSSPGKEPDDAYIFCPWKKGKPIKPMSLTVLAMREKDAWVKFPNVPIEPYAQSKDLKQ